MANPPPTVAEAHQALKAAAADLVRALVARRKGDMPVRAVLDIRAKIRKGDVAIGWTVRLDGPDGSVTIGREYGGEAEVTREPEAVVKVVLDGG